MTLNEYAATSNHLLRPVEVCRLLKLSRSSLFKQSVSGRIPSVLRGKQRMYPARAIFDLVKAHGGVSPRDDGERDARAVEMIESGATDAQIIRELRVSLERVRALRNAEGADARGAEPAVDVSAVYARIESGFLKRRAELAERRRAALGMPTPSPRHTKKKET